MMVFTSEKRIESRIYVKNRHFTKEDIQIRRYIISHLGNAKSYQDEIPSPTRMAKTLTPNVGGDVKQLKHRYFQYLLKLKKKKNLPCAPAIPLLDMCTLFTKEGRCPDEASQHHPESGL